MMKKILRHLLIYVLAFATALSYVSFPAAAAGKPVLTQEGSITISDGIQFHNDFFYKKSGDDLTLLAPDGTAVEDATALKISVNRGYFVLKKKGDPVGQCAVVSQEGKTLIPYGPALVEPVSDRFWKGVFALNATTDKKEALIYSTDDSFSIQPSDGDTMYTGEMYIYDMVTGKQVPGVIITSPSASVYEVGDSILVSDEQGKKKIYNSEGKVLEEDAGSYSQSGAFYVKREGERYLVYDSNLNKLFETEVYPYGLGESRDYLYYEDADGYPALLDKSGRELFKYREKGMLKEPVPVNTSEAGDRDNTGFVIFENTEDSEYHCTLLTKDGKEISKATYEGFSYAGNGYIFGWWNDSEGKLFYDVFDKNGKQIVKGIGTQRFEENNLAAYEDGESGTRRYYVYNKQAYSLKTNTSAASIGFCLLRTKNEQTSQYGLYDLISGEQLLPEEYEGLVSAYGRIYAQKNGTITIYNVKR